MGRRYKRREFLVDALVAVTGSVLIKVVAPGSATAASSPDSEANRIASAPVGEQVR